MNVSLCDYLYAQMEEEKKKWQYDLFLKTLKRSHFFFPILFKFIYLNAEPHTW